MSSSKKQEDKDRVKNYEKIQGHCTSQMETLHVMLTYPEVYTNFGFVYIPTMPLELRAGVEINTENNEEAEDVTYEGSAIGSMLSTLR